MPQDFIKDPQARLWYRIDWSDWLEENDVLTASTWSVPAGLTIDASQYTDTEALVKLSGGHVETRYRVTNSIATAQGNVDERSIFIVIKER